MDGLLQYLMNFGLGAVFAGVLFVAYRSMVAQMRQDRTFAEERMAKLLEQYESNCKEYKEAILDFKTALTELIIWLRARNGHG